MTSISVDSIHATWCKDLINRGFNFLYVTNDDTTRAFYNGTEVAKICLSAHTKKHAALGAFYAECYEFLSIRNKVKGS